jgi:hypothetical protein
MPSTIFKKKRFKTFSRKIRNQWRVSARASPASRSIVSDLMDDMTVPPPVSSHAVIPSCTDALQVQEVAEEVERRSDCINKSRPIVDITIKDVERSQKFLGFLPSASSLLTSISVTLFLRYVLRPQPAR